jgi:hypothetical protein
MGPLAAFLLALTAAHPGHDGEPGAAPSHEVHGNDASKLATELIRRGQAPVAVRIVAREAASSKEAALVLAKGLELLGDAPGAALARARAEALP